MILNGFGSGLTEFLVREMVMVERPVLVGADDFW